MAHPVLTGLTVTAEGETVEFGSRTEAVYGLKYITAHGLSAWYADSEGPQICECEQDWNCGLCGGTSRPTWIETRYDNEYEPEWAR